MKKKHELTTGKNFSHWAIQIFQNQASISSLISGKNTIAFYTIWAIFGRKQGGVTIKTWYILLHPNDSWSTSWKIFVPVISSFAAIGHKEHFRKNVARIFKFCCFTWYHFYIFEKESDRFPDAEFNVEAIGTNFKSLKLKTKKLVCPFLIVRFHFETNLIKCFFLRKILDSWEISSKSVWSRKICWFRQKNRPSISFQGYLPFIYGQNLD